MNEEFNVSIPYGFGSHGFGHRHRRNRGERVCVNSLWVWFTLNLYVVEGVQA